jgi:uncharacterized membrane protein
MGLLMNEENRIAHYDILRGIAISLMLMANSAAYVYTATPPLVMRLMGSFAAPSFMMLAGMMLALAKKPKPIRGLHIIVTGCLVDIVVWQIVPFVTFDVLYTIGAAILITAYPARLFSIRTLWFLGGLFLLAGQLLQWAFGYNHEILEISLPPQDTLPPIASVLHQLFIDGWFPLFPWLGFVWLGAALQRSFQAQTENTKLSQDNHFLIPCFSILSFVVFSVYWSLNFIIPEPRMDYTELFYPPDIGFCFTYVSAFCAILFFFKSMVYWRSMYLILAPFKWMGQHSLLIYILHLVAIQYILSQYFVTSELDRFLYVVLILWVLLAIIARILPVHCLKLDGLLMVRKR